MKPGIVYDTLADVQTYEAALYADIGWTFGKWQFRPPTGEILVGGEVKARLTQSEAETLRVLIQVAPLPIDRDHLVAEMARVGCYWNRDTVKVVVKRLRDKLGAGVIVRGSYRGYRFEPRAVMGG